MKGIPKMDIMKMKIFWLASLVIIAGTILFNILGLLGWGVQLIANVFFIIAWSDIVLIMLMIFKFVDREDSYYIIMLNYLLCLLLGIILPLMGLNTLIMGLYTPLFMVPFVVLEIFQVLWTYIILGCVLGLIIYVFLITRKNESIWNI
ncbi:MAG: hypothetical protein EAX96_18525 [Candidatus Lokiarchaeota archaeon]|nr:hypothetical protein [Candidatus Lokiarchaeota archaeon]